MTMELCSTLLGIAVIWGIAAVIPGPNFFVTVQTAIAHSRRQALATVAGLVTGTLIWGMAGFFGIGALFTVAPKLYVGLKLVGGAYLIYLGARLIISSFASKPPPLPPYRAAPSADGWTAWRLGLLTNLSNPKTAAFVTSLFATTMPAEPTLVLGLACVAIMVSVSLTWYSAVACVFSTAAMARAYTRLAAAIDRIAGGLFILFGARLALDR